jgi:hypothetical protein
MSVRYPVPRAFTTKTPSGSSGWNTPLTTQSGTEIVVQDAAHAHAADAVVLTVGSVLAVADSTHAHASDNLTLTSSTAIVVADAAHGHSADNLTLTLGGVSLSVAEAFHAHAADAVALTMDSTLAVAEATHGHSADAIVLTSDTGLTVADAAHAHAADNVTVTLGGATVTPDDALHGHAADAVVLTSDSTLAVNDALHGHSADSIAWESGATSGADGGSRLRRRRRLYLGPEDETQPSTPEVQPVVEDVPVIQPNPDSAAVPSFALSQPKPEAVAPVLAEALPAPRGVPQSSPVAAVAQIADPAVVMAQVIEQERRKRIERSNQAAMRAAELLLLTD